MLPDPILQVVMIKRRKVIAFLFHFCRLNIGQLSHRSLNASVFSFLVLDISQKENKENNFVSSSTLHRDDGRFVCSVDKTALTPDQVNIYKSGAIIGDGDRKRAPFLVLGLAP